MNEILPSLDDLGIKFGTDKSSAGHNYLNFYERFLQPLRHDPIKILEIGLLGGASIALWEEYFPNAMIVGADIDRKALRFARQRVAVEIVDQSNIEHLTRLALKHGPFDIIIEDGSHMWEHQITSLRTLFPFVRNCGFYIVEDLQTNYASMEKDYRGVSSTSCVEYLKKLLDFRVGDEKLDIGKEEDAFLRTYGRAMGSLNFSRHVCLIEKAYQEDGIADCHAPYVAVDARPAHIPVTLLAHLGGEGDKASRAGWIRATRTTQGIQGFSIKVDDGHACALEYRARSAGGVWSEWAAGGKYVGTRGRADNLTGFSVRLNNGDSDDFALDVLCQFADSPDIVARKGGGDFISGSGRHHLSGMQVVLRRRCG